MSTRSFLLSMLSFLLVFVRGEQVSFVNQQSTLPKEDLFAHNNLDIVVESTPPSSLTPAGQTVNRHLISVMRQARCLANCVRIFDGTLGNRKNPFGFLTAPQYDSDSCLRCSSACSTKNCSATCNGEPECLMGCNFIGSLGTNEQEILKESSSKSQIRLGRPEAICLNYEQTIVNGFLFKWNLYNKSNDSAIKSSLPVVFVVEHRVSAKINHTKPWQLLGLRFEGLIPFSVRRRGLWHQYKVTAVLADGVLGRRISEWTLAPSRPGAFKPPTDVRIIPKGTSSGKLFVALSLQYNQSSLPSCHYSLDLLPNDNPEAHSYHISKSLPFEVFTKSLGELDPSTNFTMIIRSTDSTGQVTSKYDFTRTFETPSCHQIFNYNFTICAPGPPNLISVSRRSSSSIRVKWMAPLHSSTSNQITGYEIVVRKMAAPTSYSGGGSPFRSVITVNGTTWYVDVKGLDVDVEYKIRLRAQSRAGWGQMAEVNYFVQESHVVRDMILTAMCVCLMIVALIILQLAFKRRHENAKRTDAVEELIAYSIQKTLLQQRNSKPLPGIRFQAKNPLYNQSELDFENVEIGQLLGTGAFGEVRKVRVRKRNSGEQVTLAMKRIRGKAPDDERSCLLHEIEILKLVGSHPNIVSMRGSCGAADALFVEFCPHGDLKSFLDKTRAEIQTAVTRRKEVLGTLSTRMVQYSLQIAAAMEYLVSKNVVHRDLAARNILLHTEFKVKISDFGLSRDISDNGCYQNKTSNKPLPVRWMALESLVDAKFDQKTDVWSFGVVMWEMATLGQVPYTTTMNVDLIEHLKQGHRLPRPDRCPDPLYNVMTSCWQQNADERPTFASLRFALDSQLSQDVEYFSFDNLSVEAAGSADSGVQND